jgi:thiol-disulfide isomerase/thioredoxin
VGEPIEIIAFFGTWCQTCKQSLPALLSTLDRANNPNFHLHLVGTDENMSEPADWIMEWALDYTPTYVVLQGDTELGRIEEEPLVSMEADLLEIIERGSQR